MSKVSSLQKAIEAEYGTSAPDKSDVQRSVAVDNDFTAFMKSKPKTVADPEPKKDAPVEPSVEKEVTPAAAQVDKEPIGYDGKEIYDLNAVAETVTGPLISDPSGLTDLIMWGLEWVRSTFYPGMLFKIMFTEKERDNLEELLAKYIDIDQVGETKELVPLRKDITPTDAENKTLIKWRKFVKQLNNIQYTEKERATVANYIHSKVKNISIDHIIATFGPIIGLIALEAGKVTPFVMNRKQSILNTYTNR
jgi:hypothetical protein